jgi:hypothetical protein
LKSVCAWCRAEIRAVDDDRLEVTHGICSDCAGFFRANKPGRTLRDFLDALSVPVLAVDSQAHVRIVNKAAESMLRRPRANIEGQLGGDAMECAYARLPEGCGRTVHCKACTIRRTVMKTHATGQSQINVVALQQINGPDGPHTIRFLISTHKHGDLVLLRIDEAAPAEPVP